MIGEERTKLIKHLKYSLLIGADYLITDKDADEIIKALEQEPKTGHWYANEWGNIACSECGCAALYDKVYSGESVFGKVIRVKPTFCPTCGARMMTAEGGESSMIDDRITAGEVCTFFNGFRRNGLIGVEVLDGQNRRLKIRCLDVCENPGNGLPVITVQLDKEEEAE